MYQKVFLLYVQLSYEGAKAMPCTTEIPLVLLYEGAKDTGTETLITVLWDNCRVFLILSGKGGKISEILQIWFVS